MIRVRGLFSKDLPNRSSKHLYFSGMVGVGTKPAVRSMSNAALTEMSKKLGPNAKGNIFEVELNRRSAKRIKREMKNK